MKRPPEEPKSIIISQAPPWPGSDRWFALTWAAECVRAGGAVPERCREIAVEALLAARPKRPGRKRDYAREGAFAKKVAAHMASGQKKSKAVELVAEEMGLDVRQVWRLIEKFGL
jgi:hypothetical protein